MTTPSPSVGLRRQGIGYILVGLTCVVVEYGLFLSLYYLLDSPAWLANALAFLIGLSLNFTLNRTIIFKATSTAAHRQLILYSALASFNLAFTSVCIAQLVAHGVNAAIAKIALMALVTCWNFIIYRRFVFKPS